jgi:hypothetical protein
MNRIHASVVPMVREFLKIISIPAPIPATEKPYPIEINHINLTKPIDEIITPIPISTKNQI